MTDMQEEMWYALCELPGEEVLRLLTDWHGLQLPDEGFREHLADEGVMDSICSDDQIEEDNDEIEEDDEDDDGKPKKYCIYAKTCFGKEYVGENGCKLLFDSVLDMAMYFKEKGTSLADMLRTGHFIEEV